MKLFTGWKLFAVSLALTMPFFAFVITRMVKESRFDDACSYHIQQAISSSTSTISSPATNTNFAITADSINRSIDHMDLVLKYAQDHNLTYGFTTISGKTPDEDLSVWYETLSKREEYFRSLKQLPPAELEKYNEYSKQMDLKSKDVVVPSGISIYPYNTLFFIWEIVSIVLAALGVAGIIILITEKSS